MSMAAASAGPPVRATAAASAFVARAERELGLTLRRDDARLVAALARLDDAAPGAGGGDRWETFVQDLLVHETFFFRHPRQLAAIERDVLPELAIRCAASNRAAVAIWSASCATGEEAWTLALMADAAIPGAARITGSDLSSGALDTARDATYRQRAGLGSFRSLTPALAARLGGPLAPGESWSAPAHLRRQVSFLRHNLLEPPPIGPQDLVLCRNTLIYMSPDARRRAIDVFARTLRIGGYLALGPAESPERDPRFERAGHEDAMLFRRVPDAEGGA